MAGLSGTAPRARASRGRRRSRAYPNRSPAPSRVAANIQKLPLWRKEVASLASIPEIRTCLADPAVRKRICPVEPDGLVRRTFGDHPDLPGMREHERIRQVPGLFEHRPPGRSALARRMARPRSRALPLRWSVILDENVGLALVHDRKRIGVETGEPGSGITFQDVPASERVDQRSGPLTKRQQVRQCGAWKHSGRAAGRWHCAGSSASNSMGHALAPAVAASDAQRRAS